MAEELNRYFSSVFTSERDEPPVVQEMFVRNRLENITMTAKKVGKNPSPKARLSSRPRRVNRSPAAGTGG